MAGKFDLHPDAHAYGEVSLRGRDSVLRLHSDIPVQGQPHIRSFLGVTHEGHHVTCIDCIGFRQTHRFDRNRKHTYVSEFYPHYIVHGDEHLDATAANIHSISFRPTDADVLLTHPDAFGADACKSESLERLIEDIGMNRSVPFGPDPIVSYFAGQHEALVVPTPLGRMVVRHHAGISSGRKRGERIVNTTKVHLEQDAPIPFLEAVNRMLDVLALLSTLAGRNQGVRDVRVALSSDELASSFALSAYCCYVPRRASARGSQYRPDRRDVPLDPVGRAPEFEAVVQNWIARHEKWGAARRRYLGCLNRGSTYGVDRIVAAANMFDILPSSAVPSGTNLPDALATIRDNCAESLKGLPASSERDSLLSALGRLGKPSLPKKVAHRVQVIEQALGPRFPHLGDVAKQAIQVRNYYVHGTAPFDPRAVEPFLSFLTETLEFIFVASDLIEAGWDADRWFNEPHSWGHSVARFQWGYTEIVAQWEAAMA